MWCHYLVIILTTWLVMAANTVFHQPCYRQLCYHFRVTWLKKVNAFVCSYINDLLLQVSKLHWLLLTRMLYLFLIVLLLVIKCKSQAYSAYRNVMYFSFFET